jgi:hypothetical protein
VIRHLGLAIVLLGGCTWEQPDPDLITRRRALDAWEEGKAALELGRAGAARAHFEAALEARPGDPLLEAWRARAEAATGDLDTAIATLDVVLRKRPAFAEARYNRAAYLARAGRLDEAGPELERALAAGGFEARAVLDDPDFQPHLDHPALSFLPAAPVEVALKGPGGSTFLNSEAEVRLEVVGRDLADLQVEAPPVRGPFRLGRVDVHRTLAEVGDDQVVVTWGLLATGAGEARVGPVTVRAGARSAQADSVVVQALAPPDHATPEPRPFRLSTPGQMAASAPGAGPAAWRHGTSLRVRQPVDVKMQVDGLPDDPVRWQRFDGRTLAYTLWTWDPAPTGATVRLSRQGRVLREGPVPAPDQRLSAEERPGDEPAR